MPTDAHNGHHGLTVTSLPPNDLAKLLTQSGGKSITLDMLRQDFEAGAPTNADGTVNLVHYAAWLVKELARCGT